MAVASGCQIVLEAFHGTRVLNSAERQRHGRCYVERGKRPCPRRFGVTQFYQLSALNRF